MNNPPLRITQLRDLKKASALLAEHDPLKSMRKTYAEYYDSFDWLLDENRYLTSLSHVVLVKMENDFRQSAIRMESGGYQSVYRMAVTASEILQKALNEQKFKGVKKI